MNAKHPADPQESGLSRRSFVRGVAAGGGAALALSSSMWTPRLSANPDDDKRGDDDKQGDDERDEKLCDLCPAPFPIPHLTAVPPPAPVASYHFYFPGPVEGTVAPTDPTGAHDGRDPSVIYDFRGFIGQVDLNLSGMGTSAAGSAPYTFHTDMRLMKGEWVGTDGRVHRGAVAFI